MITLKEKGLRMCVHKRMVLREDERENRYMT
jgi:hypothetical protein